MNTKNIFKTLSIAVGLIGSVAFAATPLFPNQGGTGTSQTPTADQLLVGQSTGVYKATSTLNKLQFTTGYTPTGTEATGTIYWDAANHTYSAVLEGGTILQLGQEGHLYAKNTSGVDISNGNAVSITSANGSFTAIAKTDATNPGSAYAFVGLATQDIPKNAFGYVTLYGEVRGLDTSMFPTEGRALYVDPTIPGGVTSTFPSVPNYIINVGVLEYKNNNNGRINVIRLIQPKLADLSDVNGTPLTASGQIPVWNNTGQYFDFSSNINDFLATTTGNWLGTWRSYIPTDFLSSSTSYQPQASSTINTLIGPWKLVAGTNITLSSSTNPSTITINSTATGGGATTTINGVIGPTFTFVAGTGIEIATTTGQLTFTNTGITTTTGNWLGNWKGYTNTDFLSSSTSYQPLITFPLVYASTTHVTINGTAGRITASTVTGTTTLDLATTTPSGSTCTNCNLTYDAYGRVTTSSNGTSAGTNYFTLSGTSLYPTSTAYKLGIGTTTPSVSLDVVGQSNFSATSTFNGNMVVNTGTSGTSTVSVGQTGNQGCVETQDLTTNSWSHFWSQSGIFYFDSGQCQ